MIAIGLGKQTGADTFHGQGFATFAELIPTVARFTLAQAPDPVRAGAGRERQRAAVAIEAVPAASMTRGSRRSAARRIGSLARLPIDAARRPDHGPHRQGHQRPGDGLERRRPVLHADPPGQPPLIQRIVVRDLTDETEGNAVGIGMADVVLRHAVDRMDTRRRT